MNRFFAYLLLFLVGINSATAYSIAPAKARAGPATSSYGKKASPSVASPSKAPQIVKKAKIENKKLISKNIKVVDKNAKVVNRNINVFVKTSSPKPKVAAASKKLTAPKAKVAPKTAPKTKTATKTMTPKVIAKPKTTRAAVAAANQDTKRVNPAVFKQTAYVGSVAVAVLLPILFLLAASK